MVVHYYGCKDGDFKKVKFLPCWHLATQQHIRLAPNNPAHHIHKLGLTSMSILTSKSRRLLMPIRDELFTYE